VAVEESIEREYYRVSDQLLYERANIEECGMGELLLNTHHAPTSVSLRLGRGLVARWTLHSYYAFNAKRERERTRSFPCLATANHFRSLPFLLRKYDGTGSASRRRKNSDAATRGALARTAGKANYSKPGSLA
jgi:hypothetical protein